MNLGLSSTSDVITFDQNWYHLYSTSAGGKDLSNDAQIRVIGQMDKNAQKVERKTQTKISFHYTWLLHGKNCPSWWCFLRNFLTTSKPSRRSITAAKRKEKEKKERGKKFKNRKASRQNFDFWACPSRKVVKRDASSKKGELSCCKMHFRPD